MSRRAGVAAIATVAACLLLWYQFGAPIPLAAVRRGAPFLRYCSLMSAALPSGEAVGYGALYAPYAPWDRASLNCLRWYRRGGLRQYVVMAGDTLDVDVRATSDYQGVWLVDKRGRVVASLDRQTGEFLDWNGQSVDWRLSPGQQESRGRCGHRKPYPKWATADGGVLLARWPE